MIQKKIIKILRAKGKSISSNELKEGKLQIIYQEAQKELLTEIMTSNAQCVSITRESLETYLENKYKILERS